MSREVSISQGHMARVLLVRLPHPLTERHSSSCAPELPRSPQIHHGDLPLVAIRRRGWFFPQRLAISYDELQELWKVPDLLNIPITNVTALISWVTAQKSNEQAD